MPFYVDKKGNTVDSPYFYLFFIVLFPCYSCELCVNQRTVTVKCSKYSSVDLQ